MTFSSISTQALLANLDSQLEEMLVAAIGAVESMPASTQQALQSSNQPLLLTGTFTSQTANGQAVLQTAAGPVSLSLNAPAPQGTVTVQIQPAANGGAATATVLVPSATASSQLQQAAPLAQTPELSLTPALTQAPAPPLTAGSTITGTLMPPPPATGLPTVAANSPAASLPSSPELPVAQSASTSLSQLAPSFTAPASEEVIPPPIGGGSLPPLSPPAVQPGQIAAAPTALPLSAASVSATAAPASFLETIDPALAAQEENSPATPPAFASVPPAPPPSNEAFYVVSVGDENPAPSVPVSGNAAAQSQPLPQPVPGARALPPPSGPVPANLVQASEVASTPGGQPILSLSVGALPAGTLLVNEPASVESGAVIVLQPLGPVEDLPQARGAAIPPAPLSLAGKEAWPALAGTLAALNELEPEQANALRASIPQLTMEEGAASSRDFVSSFVSFLTGGRIEAQPLPATIAAILQTAGGQGAADETKLLRAALAQAVLDLPNLAGNAAHAAQQASPSWQTYPIPVLTGAELAMLQLYVRPHIEPEEEEKDAKGKPKRRRTMTRFLVEVHPGGLGPVQLDGLLQKEQQAPQPHLDLIVRTEAELPAQSEMEMGALFESALGATGVTGRLAFQSGRDSFVLPESSAAHAYSRKV